MSAGKVIGNVIIFGGIGAMGYLLFKKKPISTNQISKSKYIDEYGNQLAIDTTQLKGRSLSQICIATKGGTEVNSIQRVWFYEKDLPNIKQLCDNLPKTLKKEIDQPLFETLTSGVNGEHIPNTCSQIETEINVLNDRIQQKLRKLTVDETNFYVAQKNFFEDKFNKFNCRDKIEAQRTKDLVDLQTKGSIKAEEAIVNKGFTEQKGYIILGALVLLTGFYVVVKK
jgi:hypothetical protein